MAAANFGGVSESSVGEFRSLIVGAPSQAGSESNGHSKPLAKELPQKRTIELNQEQKMTGSAIVNGVRKEPRWKFWRSRIWSTYMGKTQVIPEKQGQRVLSTPVCSEPPAGPAICTKPLSESFRSDFPEYYGMLCCYICTKELSNGGPYRGLWSSDGQMKEIRNMTLPKSVSKDIEIEGTCVNRFYLREEVLLTPVVDIEAATESSYNILVCSRCRNDCKMKHVLLDSSRNF